MVGESGVLGRKGQVGMWTVGNVSRAVGYVGQRKEAARTSLRRAPRLVSSETSRACFDGDGVATGVGGGGGALTGAMSDSVREVRSITI